MEQETFDRLRQDGRDLRGDWKHDEDRDPAGKNVFFYSDTVMFWSTVAILTLLPIVGYLLRDAVSHQFVHKILLIWCLSVVEIVSLRFGGYLGDRPEAGVYAFADGGRWFLLGTVLGAAFFFCYEGVAWVTAYDLEHVDFSDGFGPLHPGSQAVGLAGFLEKVVRLLMIALGAGALTRSIANKVGLKA